MIIHSIISTEEMNICYKFVQFFISGDTCIMIYILTRILLVYTNFDSEQPDSGLKNENSFNHITRTNEHLL